MPSIGKKLEQSRRNRMEEQVVAAILHMSSPWGFLALITSGVVWTTYRSRSRFLSVQAMQAFLFQLASFAAFILVFVLFMAGFYFAAFSGLIARTGVTEPELTSNLIVAMIFGFASLFFFQFIFPLWGVFAGIEILRSGNYQYPVLGKLAIRLTSREPFIVNSESLAERRLAGPDSGKIIASLGHLSILGGLGILLSPILWATNKSRSNFLSHHLLQASLFQLVMTILFTGLYFVIWGSATLFGLFQFFGFSLPAGFTDAVSQFAKYTYYPFGWLVLFGFLFLITGILPILAAIQAFRGRDFHYPMIGNWLSKYTE
jgi:uncharacterized Tic20 family protein